MSTQQVQPVLRLLDAVRDGLISVPALEEDPDGLLIYRLLLAEAHYGSGLIFMVEFIRSARKDRMKSTLTRMARRKGIHLDVLMFLLEGEAYEQCCRLYFMDENDSVRDAARRLVSAGFSEEAWERNFLPEDLRFETIDSIAGDPRSSEPGDDGLSVEEGEGYGARESQGEDRGGSESGPEHHSIEP